MKLGVRELLKLGDSILSPECIMGCCVQEGVRRLYLAALCSEGTPRSGVDTAVSVSALSKIGNLQPHTANPQSFSDNETPILS